MISIKIFLNISISTFYSDYFQMFNNINENNKSFVINKLFFCANNNKLDSALIYFKNRLMNGKRIINDRILLALIRNYIYTYRNF